MDFTGKEGGMDCFGVNPGPWSSMQKCYSLVRKDVGDLGLYVLFDAAYFEV